MVCLLTLHSGRTRLCMRTAFGMLSYTLQTHVISMLGKGAALFGPKRSCSAKQFTVLVCKCTAA